MKHTKNPSRSSIPSMPQKRGLYRVGFVKQKSQWPQDLARGIGRDDRDISGWDITLLVEKQLDSAETYCDANGNVVEKDKAVCRKFETGLCSADGKSIYAWFNGNERDGWEGVEFKSGESMHLKDLGWLVNYDGWVDRLKELTGDYNLDVGAVERNIVSQKGLRRTYLFYDGTSAEEQTADLMVFKTNCSFANSNTPIMARFKRSDRNLWKGVDFVSESEVRIKPEEITNNDSLFCAAYMPDGKWQEELAKLARPEDWGFSDSRPYSILTQYLRFTYLRLRQQKKFLVSNGKCMIFNTGLVTPSYEYIHAYFVPNKIGPYEWAWEGCGCINGTGLISRKLKQFCSSDLPTAKWFDKVEQLVFDVSKRVNFDVVHCMVQNATRLPDGLMSKVFANNEAALDQWKKFKDDIDINKVDHDRLQAKCENELSSYKDYEEIKRQLKNELEAAINLAKTIVSLDYTAAVPQYYPRDGEFSFLLPLFFGKIDENPCALVVTPAENGEHYIGKTILTREMAYSNARLLRRPTVQWILSQTEMHKNSQSKPHKKMSVCPASATRAKSSSVGDYGSPEARERLRSKFQYVDDTRW